MTPRPETKEKAMPKFVPAKCGYCSHHREKHTVDGYCPDLPYASASMRELVQTAPEQGPLSAEERARDVAEKFYYTPVVPGVDWRGDLEGIITAVIRAAEVEAYRRAAMAVDAWLMIGPSHIGPLHGIGWNEAIKKAVAAILALIPPAGPAQE